MFLSCHVLSSLVISSPQNSAMIPLRRLCHPSSHSGAAAFGLEKKRNEESKSAWVDIPHVGP